MLQAVQKPSKKSQRTIPWTTLYNNRTSAPAYLNLEDRRYAFLVLCRVGGMEIDFLPVDRDDSEGPGMAM